MVSPVRLCGLCGPQALSADFSRRLLSGGRLPIQRPFPVWMGGMTEPALKRTGRPGDGWFPLHAPDD